MKRIENVLEAPGRHWVGDGFPVRSLFSYQAQGRDVSPFLLLDYAAPMEFSAGRRPRGVGEHPHRGFETVTIVFAGEVSHRDSSGGGGTIRAGDVQWMTAGAGLVHDEFHSEAFTKSGGQIEMAQLWVNLPAEHKMTAPRYQSLGKDSIPTVDLPDGGYLRVIAGTFDGVAGPAKTFTPIDVWDVGLAANQALTVPAPDGSRLIVVLLAGAVAINGELEIEDTAAVVLSPAGADARVQASRASRLLVLAGEPIDEPLVGYGPFVMNTEQEIREAIEDFSSGRFGRLSSPEQGETR